MQGSLFYRIVILGCTTLGPQAVKLEPALKRIRTVTAIICTLGSSRVTVRWDWSSMSLGRLCWPCKSLLGSSRTLRWQHCADRTIHGNTEVAFLGFGSGKIVVVSFNLAVDIFTYWLWKYANVLGMKSLEMQSGQFRDALTDAIALLL